MTFKKSLLLLIPLLALARIFFFAPNQPVKDASAAWCGGCGTCTNLTCCCGAGKGTSCNPCDTCASSCPCTAQAGNWGTCSTTTFKQTCGTASCGGAQNCSPAGGSQTCCAVNTTCNISTDYNTTGSTQALNGCANGAMVISGGTTTVSAGDSLLFGSTLTVSGGILTVVDTGKLGASTTCSAI